MKKKLQIFLFTSALTVGILSCVPLRAEENIATEALSQETAEETVEGLTEEVAEEVVEEATGEIVEEVTEEVSEGVAEEIAENMTEESAEQDAYTLQQVVVLSRHNIRSPLTGSGSVTSDLTNHEWFSWTSNPGELSLKGAMLETAMGQYFRLWLEKEGLFPENYIPRDGAVRFYANGLQRTQATAHYFSTGLLPVAVTPVERHVEYNELDNTFLPLVTFMNEDLEADVLDQIAEEGGGEGLTGYREELDDTFDLMADVLDMEDTQAFDDGAYEEFMNGDSFLTLEEGAEPKLSGPLKTACSIADSLVLQYYEEPDESKAAFGHDLSLEDWQNIGSALEVYEKILFTSPILSIDQAHPMLQELYWEMNATGRQFSFLCGHDSNISCVLAALGVEEYTLPGAIEPTTPIGTKVVFERWADAQGEEYFKVNLVYQSVEQLRSVEALTLENPPMIVPISFTDVETNENGMIAEADLMDLFERKIAARDLLVEEYSVEKEEAA